jgi:hypothetical protein
VEIIDSLREELVAIGYIPYTNIIDLDTNTSDERGGYILWCKFNMFSKFRGINPYIKMSYCKQLPKSNDAARYGYFYDEQEEVRYNVFIVPFLVKTPGFSRERLQS